MKTIYVLGKTLALAALILPVTAPVAEAQPNAKNQRVFDYWTSARMNQAIPRQLVIASNGEGYLKLPNGDLRPHGHDRLVEMTKVSKQPQAKPGGDGGDNEGPAIAPIEPADGATIGASQRFAANITDASGVRSADLVIIFPDNSTQTFAMSNAGGDTWESNLQGFTDDTGWGWQVEAKDASKGKGNTSSSDIYTFDVDTGGGGGGGGGGNIVTNSDWGLGGAVQVNVGRIYFEMPNDRRLRRWSGYVCSGTVATDNTSGRSVIITSAHCVYDDVYKAFARNVLFIPNQVQTTGFGTDTNCGNDPLGCWTPGFGVVDTNWTTRSFPDNIPWDYAYYVVDDSGAHSGNGAGGSLEGVVGGLPIDFSTPFYDGGGTSASDPD